MKNLNFVALDVETANENHSSICQIGLARFVEGELVETMSTLINPKQEFSGYNIQIHGIEPSDVVGQPCLADVIDSFWQFIGDSYLVSHSAFDKTAIKQACERYRLPFRSEVKWLDSALIARRSWAKFAYRGSSLANVTKFLGIKFKHHDALEDAIACGKVLVAACHKKDLSLDDWYTELKKKNSTMLKELKADVLNGNFDSELAGLAGNTIVFTGKLSMLRSEAELLAARAGCEVGKSVTKQTTMLVVGDQDLSGLAGHSKSSKHRRAEELIKQRYMIRILGESEFIKLVDLASPELVEN